MKDRKQIKKLAKSLFSIALKTQTIKQTGDSFRLMAGLLERSPEILTFFRDIFQPEERHLKVLKSIADMADFTPVATAYFSQLTSGRHMDWVPIIHEYFQRLADQQLSQERALVLTPFPLGKADRDALVSSLAAMTGKKIFLREQIDPALIAGVKVRIGSTIFDGSLVNQLQRIEKEISNAR